LANLTGLNKTTISSLVEELIDRGLVWETGLANSGGGRPAMLLDLDPHAGCMIGIALGVDFASAIVTDFVGQIQWRRIQDTDPEDDQESVIAQAQQLADEAVAACRSMRGRLLGLGLAIPGTVDVEDGLLVFSPNLQWRAVPLREIFQEHTGLRAFVDNDANAAALAEHLFGATRGVQNFVTVYLGVGVGGGLFLNGNLYRGADGFAGEIGHMNFVVDHYQRPCRCGSRGCWETSVAQDAVVERVRSSLSVGRNSVLRRLMAEQRAPLSVPLIVEAADLDDAEAIGALTETGSLLGLGVANLVSVFNPEMVVLGGPLSIAARYLLPPVREAIDGAVASELRGKAQVVTSAFGADASVMGAVGLVLEAILSHPNSVERKSINQDGKAATTNGVVF
jgi:glucokinase-like ROK family protein